jgi:hypothetical protein
MDRRIAWSAAGGTAATLSGTSAVAWAVGASADKSSLPLWPAFVLGGITLIALYVLGAALTRSWPFHHLALAPAELLDDCIRRGRDLRELIHCEDPDGWEASRDVAEWMLVTANLLHEHFPAVADEFLLAHPTDGTPYDESRPAVRALASRVELLTRARKELRG